MEKHDLPDDTERAGAEHQEAAQAEVALAEAVREYLRRHPQSMDTVEGIAEWWIPSSTMQITAPVLRRVLDRLTQDGFLERVGFREHAHYRARRK